MNIVGFIFGVMGLGAMSVMAAAPETGIRVAIISDSALSGTADMLMVEVSKMDHVVLLEREQVRRVFAENQLQAEKTPQGYRQIGKILQADCLVLLHSVKENGRQMLAARLVAVDLGVVLKDERYRLPVEDSAVVAESLCGKLTPWFSKLHAAQDAVCVSIVGLFATVDSLPARQQERELSFLLAQRLTREPTLLVMERKRQETLAWEKEFIGETGSPFLTGQYLLEGSFGEENVRIRVTARLAPRGKDDALVVQASGTATNLAGVVDELAGGILASLKKSSAAKPWDTKAEADAYYQQAVWAFEHKLLPEAQQAAEAAYALGRRDDPVVELAARAYCLEAYPYFGMSSVGHSISCYRWADLDVRENPHGLECVIRAMEIVNEHLARQPRTEQKFVKHLDMGETHYDYRIMSVRVILTASRVLRAHYDDSCVTGREARLAYLRQQIRDAACLLIREGGNDSRGAQITYLESCYASYWYETPEEVIAAYRNILQRAGQFKGTDRSATASWLIDRDPVRRDGRQFNRPPKREITPWLLAEKPEDAKGVFEAWDRFLKELAESARPEDQAAAWLFKYHDYFFRERGKAADGRARSRNDEAEYRASLEPAIRQFLQQHRDDFGGKKQPCLAFERLAGYISAIDQLAARQSSPWREPETPRSRDSRPKDGIIVTRFWQPYKYLNITDNKVFDVTDLKWQDGRLWFVANDRDELVVVDLDTFQAESVSLPAVPAYVKFLPDGIILSDQEKCYKYEKTSRQWSPLALPCQESGGGLIDPFLYRTFTSSSFRDRNMMVDGSPQGSGVCRLDTRTGKTEILASSRRKPALNCLDDQAIYNPLAVFEGKDGLPCLLMTRGEWENHSLYRLKKDGSDWDKLYDIGVPKSIEATAKGLLLTCKMRYFPHHLNQCVFIPGNTQEPVVLLLNPHADSILWQGPPRWEIPPEMVDPKLNQQWDFQFAYDGERLYVFTRHQGGKDHALRVFQPNRKECVTIPLHFEASSSDLEAIAKHQPLSMSYVDWPMGGMVITSKGLVLNTHTSGFWFIPKRDIDGFCATTH